MQMKKNMNMNMNKGFTIVELLVVIVVIGILAAITIVSYSGIRQRANLATLQSDLKNASTQLEVSKTTSNDETYPSDQSSANLKASDGTTFAYTRSTTTSYCLAATNNGVTYHIRTTSKTIVFGACSDWIVIGTQVWAKYNLNVGTMVTGATTQSNNATLEKYCYNNLEANCTTYGGLYQWDEAMQYVTTEGAQGICPAGSHIPTDNDWKILEMQLGMTQVQADATGWRGTDQGTQLKPGGSSGLNMPLAGYRSTGGSFGDLGVDGNLWSSSESGSNAWYRYLLSGGAGVNRNIVDKSIGLSVRCLEN